MRFAANMPTASLEWPRSMAKSNGQNPIGGNAVSRSRAADDFTTIRARMEELRREREQGLSGREATEARARSRRGEIDAERRRRERIEGVPPPWVRTIFVRKPRS